MIPIPPSKPQVILKNIERLMARKGYDSLIKQGEIYCVAVRGYYLNTLGAPNENDLNMYDDMVCWFAPNGLSAYNFNTDPTRFGWNKNAGRYMAQLAPGMYRFVMRKHKGKYDAFGQGDNPVTVYRRDSRGRVVSVEEGLFGINIHSGGDNTTSSEGCQTVPPSQWLPFKEIGYSLLRGAGQKTFRYALFDEKTERAIKQLTQ